MRQIPHPQSGKVDMLCFSLSQKHLNEKYLFPSDFQANKNEKEMCLPF